MNKITQKELKEIMDDCLMTNVDLAKLIGVTVSTVSRWKNGRTSISIKHQREILRIYEDIMNGDIVL